MALASHLFFWPAPLDPGVVLIIGGTESRYRSRIVVRCQSDLQCYEVLGRLSLTKEFEKHQRDFVDYMAQPKLTGYRAISTTVLHRTRDDVGTLLRVEILPSSVDDARLRP